MAIQPCKECGGPVSDKAESCPRCGAKTTKRPSILVIFGLILIVLYFLGSYFNNNKSVNKVDNNPIHSETVNNFNNWKYEIKKDDLHNVDIKYAGTESLNLIDFDFPYDGGSKLMLSVRKNHLGSDVLIAITKGQFICDISYGCEVTFKFDDEKIINVTMVKPESYASDILFIKSDATERKIVEKLKTSKKLIIAPVFYKHGQKQFTFDVSNYKPI